MMDKQDSAGKKDYFAFLIENNNFKSLRAAFDKFFDRPIWWMCRKKASNGFVEPMLRTQRARDMEDYLSLSEHKQVIIKATKYSEKMKVAVVFEQPLNSTYGIAIPLIIENKINSFFGVCSLKSKPSQGIIDILFGYANVIMEEVAKEKELAKLYELVRPRAIALSTVHTIHRLISSTLDIKELFPRVARLSLQVLRAERARICMWNKHTKKLTTVAAVDYKKSKDMFKITGCTSVERRVIESGRSVLKKNILCVPLVDEEVCGVIAVRDKIGQENFGIFDQEILTTLAEQAIIAIRNAHLYKEQEDLTIGTIRSLSYLLDAKFPRIYTHTEFFVELMLELGKEMGLARNELKLLHYSAILPDLGKLVVPEEILKKPKALSGKERNIIKSHTIRGIEVLRYLDVLKPVVPIILHHHEKYNGKGYPDKLKGKKIPMGSRIMAVADAFEAMICHRPYRKPLPFRMAVSEIRRQSAGQFDPAVVDAFIRIADSGKLEELIRNHRNEFKRVF